MRGRLRKRTVSLAKPAQVYDLRSEYVGGRPADSVEVEIENPHNTEQKIVVYRGIRDDPLAGMFSRGQIDKAMLEAGLEWQRHHENSTIGAISAIDPEKEKVDGGKIYEPITIRQIKALKELAKAKAILGDHGQSLVYDVLARRMQLIDVARERMMTRDIEINYIGRRFRECLDDLAKLWGFRA
jgi:hypothetical protein